jgi:sterol desaturase/sphingolipid hydroxylase (fatty acid hydroxylase superfamily)
MSLFSPLFALSVLGVILLAILIEAVVLSRRNGYNWRSTGVSMFSLLSRTSMQALVPIGLATPLILLAREHRLMTIELDHWLAFLALFLGQEFCYYWFHRTAHRVRWFWCGHAVHHTPNELNLSAALRISSLGRLTGTQLFYVPLVWLGYPAEAVFATLQLNLLYQFWVHTSWIPKLGWLEYVLNTPSAHRVHHASNLNYLDTNYGGVLIVFDRLFGTYREERADEPCRYGLVHPVTTYNPFKIEFHEWMGLVRDLRTARSLGEVLGYLFMPPGWKPNGQSSTTEDLRRQANLAPSAPSAPPLALGTLPTPQPGPGA